MIRGKQSTESMSYATGYQTVKITTTDYNELLSSCSKYKSDGYEFHSAKRKRQWPFFWIVLYKVKMRRHFVFADGQIATYSSKEIEKFNL
jgi:hypothetical protein